MDPANTSTGKYDVVVYSPSANFVTQFSTPNKVMPEGNKIWVLGDGVVLDAWAYPRPGSRRESLDHLRH